MTFGCIYHILSLYNNCLLHLCTLYTTPLSPGQTETDQERTASVKTRAAVPTNAKKCYYFIFVIFYIYKTTSFVLCIVHIGTTHMHVYACIPLSTLFYTPIFKLYLPALTLSSSWTCMSQHGRLAAFCRSLTLSSTAIWW